jgi:hypothetical protein
VYACEVLLLQAATPADAWWFAGCTAGMKTSTEQSYCSYIATTENINEPGLLFSNTSTTYATSYYNYLC